MNAAALAAARVVARARAGTVTIRASRDFTDDPPEPFGIAFVKVVAEEAVQAIAYGDIAAPPAIVVRWNPLSRDAAPLEPFAAALDTYLHRELRAGRPPRIWLGHGPALTLVDLLGRRYERNKQASAELQRMGWQCRALADEHGFPGQQAIVVAGEALRRHLVTGQSPVEDAHLGALLAWVNAPDGSDPAVAADAAALIPASGILTDADDRRVEALRRIGKGSGAAAAAARREIERILRQGVRHEWTMLQTARAALFGLGLSANPNLDRLSRASMDRLTWRIPDYRSTPSRPHSLARLLGDHEAAAELAADAEVHGDRIALESQRRAGRVVRFRVLAVDQPTANRFPCRLTLRAEQDVLRLRPGGAISLLAGGLLARVETMATDRSGTTVQADLTKGVRSVPGVGSVADWTTVSVVDLRFRMGPVWSRLGSSPPAVLGDAPIPSQPRLLAGRDLADIVAGLRGER